MELKDFVEQTIEEFKSRLYNTLDGLSKAELNWRPDPQSNSISFVTWHVARVEDRWTMRFGQGLSEDVWVRGGWFQSINLSENETGARYTIEQLENFPTLSIDDLRGYFDAVRKETLAYLRGLNSSDFDLIPGRAPFADPPHGSDFGRDFSVARMYRQLIGEENQHLGHVAYIRGLQRGLNS